MHVQKLIFVKLSEAWVAVTFSLVGVCYGGEREQQLHILESHVREDQNGKRISEVKVKVDTPEAVGSAALGTEVILVNESKTLQNPKIFSNIHKTIVGFNTSPARASYNINLIYLSTQGGYSVNQRLNGLLGTMLKVNRFTKIFNEDGLYLQDIRDQTLRIEFRSDDAREFFSFEVSVDPNGQLRLLAN